VDAAGFAGEFTDPGFEGDAFSVFCSLSSVSLLHESSLAFALAKASFEGRIIALDEAVVNPATADAGANTGVAKAAAGISPGIGLNHESKSGSGGASGDGDLS